jgi:hypothetical protein
MGFAPAQPIRASRFLALANNAILVFEQPG